MTLPEFESIFRNHYSSLCSYAANYVRDPETSEEIVQEIMVKLWTNRHTLEIHDSVKGYLFRAVRNGCLNHIKHQDVHQNFVEASKAGNYEKSEDPEQVMIKSELEAKIRTAIDHLPLERRKVFCLSRYDGLTYPEISDKLGISVKTVENQIGAALKTLRKELAEYLPLVFILFYNIFRDQ